MLPADQLAAVEAMHRKFLQSVARRLGDALETSVSTDLSGIEQVDFSDFLRSCDGSACLIPLQAGARDSRALLELTPGFLHQVLALLIGAPEDAERPQRGITGIERHILRECVDNLISDLRETWASRGVHLEAASIAQDDAPDERPVLEGPAVVFQSVLRLGGSEESVRLAVPALLVRLAVMGRQAKEAPPPAAARPVLLDAMLTAAVRVEALMSGPTVRMRDLLALTPGQVLVLGPPANCAVECGLNGLSKFRGELVSNGRSQAFQIGEPIEPRDSRGNPPVSVWLDTPDVKVG